MQTEQLINNLTEEMQAVAPAPSPARVFLRWMIYTILYMAVSLLFLKVRPDLVHALHSPWFAAELASLAAVMTASLLSAAVLAFPDMYQRKNLAFLPLWAFAVFAAVLAVEYVMDNPPSPPPVHHMECLLCITALSLIPGAFILYNVRKFASTHYYASGLIAALAAFSTGALILRISEETNSIAHVLHWHYLPMILAAAIGVFLGKLCLKW